MFKISKEVRTGILAIIALVIVIGGYNYLKGKNLLDKNRNFYALYDNVEGLTPGANVTINGLTVGKVISIKFADKSGMLKVHFDVVSDFEFSNKSIARVYGIGFISGKNLAIVPSYEGELAKDGDILASEIDNGIMELVTERLEPLQAVIESAINDTDSLVKSVNSVLDKDTQSNLKEAIANFSAISRELKTTSRSMNGLLTDNKEKLNGTITNFEEISSNFAKISDSLSQVEIGTLISNIENLVSDFEGIANNLKSGKGTAGKLLQDDQVYVNLERTTKQMELLMEDMRLNPKRYVHFSLFGKKPKEYISPKDSLR
ncbi:MAG: phospholipid/cholesterol/gamma-HCH transport system substrate-binding protein [Dokdonia sp.]|jgi:phospholipid/cholesterol/gamma-HCH transport system substrate-binding protein